MDSNEFFALLCLVVVSISVIGLAVRKDFHWFKKEPTHQQGIAANDELIFQSMKRIDRAANRPRRVK